MRIDCSIDTPAPAREIRNNANNSELMLHSEILI